MIGDNEMLMAIVAVGLAVGLAVLGYMIVVFRRLKAVEERALRLAKETSAAAVRETGPLFFKRYTPD